MCNDFQAKVSKNNEIKPIWDEKLGSSQKMSVDFNKKTGETHIPTDRTREQ